MLEVGVSQTLENGGKLVNYWFSKKFVVDSNGASINSHDKQFEDVENVSRNMDTHVRWMHVYVKKRFSLVYRKFFRTYVMDVLRSLNNCSVRNVLDKVKSFC